MNQNQVLDIANNTKESNKVLEFFNNTGNTIENNPVTTAIISAAIATVVAGIVVLLMSRKARVSAKFNDDGKFVSDSELSEFNEGLQNDELNKEEKDLIKRSKIVNLNDSAAFDNQNGTTVRRDIFGKHTKRRDHFKEEIVKGQTSLLKNTAQQGPNESGLNRKNAIRYNEKEARDLRKKFVQANDGRFVQANDGSVSNRSSSSSLNNDNVQTGVLTRINRSESMCNLNNIKQEGQMNLSGSDEALSASNQSIAFDSSKKTVVEVDISQVKTTSAITTITQKQKPPVPPRTTSLKKDDGENKVTSQLATDSSDVKATSAITPSTHEQNAQQQKPPVPPRTTSPYDGIKKLFEESKSNVQTTSATASGGEKRVAPQENTKQGFYYSSTRGVKILLENAILKRSNYYEYNDKENNVVYRLDYNASNGKPKDHDINEITTDFIKINGYVVDPEKSIGYVSTAELRGLKQQPSSSFNNHGTGFTSDHHRSQENLNKNQ